VSPVDGLLVLDKPAGCTSHDVVARCRRVYRQRKVGHAGTLDPDATGVLLVGLGQATRLLQYLSGLPKRYTGEVVLGVATSTLDASGHVTGRWEMSAVSLEAARKAALALTGEISQVPPMVSALKVGGRRLHELARAGIEVERAARPVTVGRFDVALAEVWQAGVSLADVAGCGGTGVAADLAASGPVLAIDVLCSSGTYVRSLAADLGTALGGGAHLRRLRRLAVGDYGVEESVSLDALEAMPEPAKVVLRPAEALRGMARVTVTGELAAAVGHGQVLAREALEGLRGAGDGPWAVLSGEGVLLAVYQAHGRQHAKPSVVLSPPGRAGG
jgi:tRNA pseudouridine55 synthase